MKLKVRGVCPAWKAKETEYHNRISPNFRLLEDKTSNDILDRIEEAIQLYYKNFGDEVRVQLSPGTVEDQDGYVITFIDVFKTWEVMDFSLKVLELLILKQIDKTIIFF